MAVKANVALLEPIVVLAADYRTAREVLMQEAIVRVDAQMAAKQDALDKAIMTALDAGHTITDVARAAANPGKTPNRAAIYAAKVRRVQQSSYTADSYPFRWEPRTTETVDGPTKTFRAVGILVNFGPDEVSGLFKWDFIDGELEPVYDDFTDPVYPNTRFYTSLLSTWLTMNPFPGKGFDNESV